MKLHRIAAVGLAVALFAAFVTADEKTALKSGPQPGEELAGPFAPLNINGKNAGDKNCLYCSNGQNPVAMIFAREPSETLTKLIKKLDAACEKNSKAKLGSFVVFCSDNEDLEKKLKKCAKDCDLKHVVLSIDNQAGPEGYKVAKEADITVVLYVQRTAKANWAFKKGEMKDKHVDAVISGLKTILPKG